MIHKLGIVSKPGRDDIPALLEQVLPWLESRGLDYACDRVTASYLGRPNGFVRSHLEEDFDLMLVLGGDGTLLSVARGVGPRETPLLAVNLGGLGFLMTTGPEEIFAALEKVLGGDYQVQRRTVLSARVLREGQTVAGHNALNDVVVNKAAIARLLHLEIYIDDELMCGYRADGLILSTPTGSTAYSLAAGGPVISPAVASICVTPICPHTLSNRPVVVPDTAKIEIVLVGGDDSTFLTLDGQVGVNLSVNDRVQVSKADYAVRVIQPENLGFFDVLRAKMQWGGR